MILSPILINKGHYIIDGHHRWSQLYMVNDKAKIVAYDIKQVDGIEIGDEKKKLKKKISTTNGELSMCIQKIWFQEQKMESRGILIADLGSMIKKMKIVWPYMKLKKKKLSKKILKKTEKKITIRWHLKALFFIFLLRLKIFKVYLPNLNLII